MPVIMPLIILLLVFLFFYIFVGRGMFRFKKYRDDVLQKIKDFKNKSFNSYEEESKAKQQLKQDLLLSIKNMPIHSSYNKALEYQVDII